MSDLIECEYLGISKLSKNAAISFNWIAADRKHKQWVAKITGVCTKFGYKREFMQSTVAPVEKHPELRAFKWELPPGHIFQYKNFMVDYLTDYTVDGFFVTNINGIIPLETEQVRMFLNMPVKDRENYKRPSFAPVDDKKYVPDDVPF